MASPKIDPPEHGPSDVERIHVLNDAGGSDAPDMDAERRALVAPAGDAALAIELEWLTRVYQGGHVRQATFRAIMMGSILGGVMAVQHLFIALKTGMNFGVAITASILSHTIYSGLTKLAPRVFGPPMSILENNAMQSTASSAGYSTGSVMTSAVAAYLLVEGRHVAWPALAAWTFFLAVLGTVMAIPMKRQMINIEQLKFPSGVAAAETLRSLHAEGAEGGKRARVLGWAAAIGAAVSWFREAHAGPNAGAITRALCKLSKLPATIEIPGLKIAGEWAVRWTIGIDGSLLMVAAGALMGLRTTFSMLVASLVNYGVIAPWIHGLGGIQELGFKGIFKWSVWPGAAIIVTSGMVTFGLRWRTVSRAFTNLRMAFLKREEHAPGDPMAEVRARIDAVEVPISWFVGGLTFATLGIVVTGKVAFDIPPLLGLVAVALSFVLSFVACRAAGETDTTPIGAMGKITQLTYGLLAPRNVVTNLMTASITAGAAASAADLLTDLKSGYVLGANPRKQFLAQLAGTVVGTAIVVPAFYLLVPSPDVLGGDVFPAPSAHTWKAAAELLSGGVNDLHWTARWGIVVGAILGIVIPLCEVAWPAKKELLPSAMGIGLALVLPAPKSIAMFLGALIAWAWWKMSRDSAERYTTAISSGLIAGESLMGVAILALGAVFGHLE